MHCQSPVRTRICWIPESRLRTLSDSARMTRMTDKSYSVCLLTAESALRPQISDVLEEAITFIIVFNRRGN